MIVNDDCLRVMKGHPANCFSAIVTDPPYGLNFMNKEWDHGIPGEEYWRECLRISKPGSYLLAMGGTRTSHRLACSIENAGWEIRDCLIWLYGSGFPKSHNRFGFDGWGTALKPAYELIIMAMKPCDGTFKQNAEKWGQAGINIDGCRVGSDDTRSPTYNMTSKGHKGGAYGSKDVDYSRNGQIAGSSKGRWPSNVILDEFNERVLILKDNLPNDIISVIQEYYCDYELSSLSEENRNISKSCKKEKRTILQSNMLLVRSSGTDEKRETSDVGQETQERICSENANEQKNVKREVQSQISGLLAQSGLSPHQPFGANSESTRIGQADDKSTRNSRASDNNGDPIESTTDAFGSCPSSQWSEGRQQDREFGNDGQLNAQNGTQRDSERTPSIKIRERTLKVLACDVPERWLKYFADSREEIRSSHCAAKMLDEQSGILKSGAGDKHSKTQNGKIFKGLNPMFGGEYKADSGGASRFFYCAKASSRERNEGIDCYLTVKHDIDQIGDLWKEENIVVAQLLQRDIYGLTDLLSIDVFGENITAQFHKDSSSIIKTKTKQIIESKTSNLLTLSPTNEFIRDVASWMEIGSSHVVNVELKNAFQRLITNGVMVSALGVSNVALKMLSLISDEGNWKEKRSTHPTVKPLRLMEYLIKLVMPPSNGILLDPFAGSGTTILAAKRLGFDAIGIEKSKEYCEIANARLAEKEEEQEPDLISMINNDEQRF